MTKEKVTDLSSQHNSWLSALDFYKQELNIIKTRLTELAGKNTGKEMSAQVEHFENQVKVQGLNVDELRHNINETLAKTAAQAKENSAGYVDAALIQEDAKHGEMFATTEKVINELRQEFNRFASQWM